MTIRFKLESHPRLVSVVREFWGYYYAFHDKAAPLLPFARIMRWFFRFGAGIESECAPKAKELHEAYIWLEKNIFRQLGKIHYLLYWQYLCDCPIPPTYAKLHENFVDIGRILLKSHKGERATDYIPIATGIKRNERSGGLNVFQEFEQIYSLFKRDMRLKQVTSLVDEYNNYIANGHSKYEQLLQHPLFIWKLIQIDEFSIQHYPKSVQHYLRRVAEQLFTYESGKYRNHVVKSIEHTSSDYNAQLEIIFYLSMCKVGCVDYKETENKAECSEFLSLNNESFRKRFQRI